MSSIALVVPCYNEAKRLDGAAFQAALDADPDLRFVFVDDGSTDQTRAVLERLARSDRIEALILEKNQGKAEAVRRGVQRALETKPDLFGYWDADLATPLDAVAGLRGALEAQAAYLLAMGARVQLLGRDIRRSWVRHVLGRITATLSARVLGVPVYDTQCGAKLFRRAPVTAELFDEPFATGWIFDVELLARLGNALAEGDGQRLADAVVEVPLDRWVDVGKSSVRPHDFFLGMRDLRRIRRRYGPGRRRASPRRTMSA